MNKLIDNIKNSEEYAKLKPYEGTLVKQWKLTSALIICLIGIVLLISFVYLYASNFKITFLIIFSVSGAVILVFGSLYGYFYFKNRRIKHDVMLQLDSIFMMRFLQQKVNMDNKKGINITSITSRPEIPLGLKDLSDKFISENFINGTYKGIPFSFGSITELSESPLYGNETFQSLEKAWSSYYRYTVLSFKLPNQLKKNEVWHLNFKTQPKYDFLTANDVFKKDQINQLSGKVKTKILSLISKTRFIPEIKITPKIQTVVGKIYHITNLGDNTGMINHIELNNSFNIIQNVYDCITRDADALENTLSWIMDYTA